MPKIVYSMQFKNILAIGAHPDDIEYGCLGFLNRHAETSKIHLFVLSVGSNGDATSNGQRIREAEMALAGIRYDSLKIRNEKGITMEHFDSIMKDIEAYLSQHAIDLILTHGPHDTHQEHILTHQLTITAARRKKLSILNYAIVSNDLRFQPNYFFELSEKELASKIAQIRMHHSQSNKQYMQPDYIRSFHQYPYTLVHDITYCEAFEIERIMI